MDLQKVSGSGKGQEKSEKTSKADSVSLSKKAKELSSSSTESIARHVDALPDIRADKVQDVKEKIASGYFNTPEFDEELANRLMKEFGF
jgi:flagellar biosynthesis anti-sigma factor FlgM